MKTEIFNLIILDESGSMDCVKAQTVSGCNETLNTIRTAQEKFADTQTHYVSIYVFQSDGPKPSRYLVKNQPIGQVAPITAEQYDPWGCTPLYDAVGSTLADLKAVTKERELAIGSVTIITDGLENASRHYSQHKVAQMIDALKELGWSFNFIGANIDVEAAATAMHIDEHLLFSEDAEGTEAMFGAERQCRGSYYDRINEAMACPDAPCEEGSVRNRLREAAANYFGKGKKKKNEK